MSAVAIERSQLRGIRDILRRLHPGGFHYADSMKWGSDGTSRRFYAIATVDGYFTAADSTLELLRKVQANVPRGQQGNEFTRVSELVGK